MADYQKHNSLQSPESDYLSGACNHSSIIISEMQGKYYKKITQSVIFFPYFISWVIVGAFVYNIFNYETGLLNGLAYFAGNGKNQCLFHAVGLAYHHLLL